MPYPCDLKQDLWILGQLVSIIYEIQPKIAHDLCSLFPSVAPSFLPFICNTALWRRAADRGDALQPPLASPSFWHFADRFMAV